MIRRFLIALAAVAVSATAALAQQVEISKETGGAVLEGNALHASKLTGGAILETSLFNASKLTGGVILDSPLPTTSSHSVIIGSPNTHFH